MNKLRKRLILDALLTALLVFEMFFQLTGDFLHEIIGMVFFLTIVVHLVLSRKWIANTTRAASEGRKLKKGNALRAAFGIALGITSLALMASSIAISNQLYTLFGVSLAGAAYSTWVVAHTISSYLLCGLVAGHLAIHWASVAAAFRIPYNHERRAAINTGMTALAALGVAAIGLRGSDALAAAVESAAQSVASSDASTSARGTMEGVSDLNAPSTASPSAAASVADASASTSATATVKGGKNRNRSRQKGMTADTSSNYAPSDSYYSEAPDEEYYETPSADYYEAPSGSYESDSSSTVTGYCTLCPKHCPLSAPQCNRPYAAGLI